MYRPVRARPISCSVSSSGRMNGFMACCISPRLSSVSESTAALSARRAWRSVDGMVRSQVVKAAVSASRRRDRLKGPPFATDPWWSDTGAAMPNTSTLTLCWTPTWNKAHEGVGLEHLLLSKRHADSTLLAIDDEQGPFRL